MKTIRRFCCIFLFILSGIDSLSAQQLEIHQLNVGQGDAAVILTRGKNKKIRKIMIIDFGKKFSNDLIGPYLKDILGYTGNINYAIVSHYDVDHYAGFSKFAELYLEANGKKINRMIIPGGIGSSLQYPMGGLTPGKNDWNPALPKVSDTSKLGELPTFLSNITNTKIVSAIFQLSERQQINWHFVLDTLDEIPVTMELVAGLQYVKGTSSRKLSNNTTYNDDCLAWVLHFGEFRFYTGGDLGGYDKGYVDHESLLADYFTSNTTYNATPLNKNNKDNPAKGHVCVAKINHHGSNESSNKKFLETTNPSAWLISCGLQINFDHPTNAVLDRMLNCSKKTTAADGIRGIFITSLPYAVDTGKLTSRFSDKKKFYYAYTHTMINRETNPTPEGTYTITVKPSNEFYVDEENDITEDISITKTSAFTISYWAPNGMGNFKPASKVFICHEK
jgi:hypothetical protein